MSAGELKVEISEGDLKNAIAVCIAESFGPDKRDALLRDVIRAHIDVRKNTYDKDTLLSKSVGDMIRRCAEEEIAASFGEKIAPRVREIVRERMDEKYCDSVVLEVERAIASLTVDGLRFSASIVQE